MFVNKVTSSDANNLLFDLWQIPNDKPLHKKIKKKLHVVPFPTPSSLMRTYLSKLKCRNYLITVKNDGIRSILIFGYFKTSSNGALKNMALFIKRNGAVSQSNFFSVDNDIYCGTVFDGELSNDGTFIVFDLVAKNGYSYTSQSLPTRLATARDAVANLSSKVASSVITVKDFYDKKESRHLFDAF